MHPNCLEGRLRRPKAPLVLKLFGGEARYVFQNYCADTLKYDYQLPSLRSRNCMGGKNDRYFIPYSPAQFVEI